MNANQTNQKEACQIFEAGNAFAECCETAANENAGKKTSEENPGADAARLAEEGGDENAGGDSEIRVISSEASRKETFAEVSARVLREFCDRLGTAYERYPEIFSGGPL